MKWLWGIAIVNSVIGITAFGFCVLNFIKEIKAEYRRRNRRKLLLG